MSKIVQKNIGFDASRAFIAKKTGTENYSYQLLKHLLQVDQNNKYYIYTRSVIPSKEGIQLTELGLELDPRLHGDDSPHFIPIRLPKLWTQIGLATRTFIDPLDVLFIPAHTLPIIRKPGLKTILTVHDLGAKYLPQTHQLKQQLYLSYMTHYQLKSATHLIAVSQATRDDLVKKVGIDPNKITVVYEGYNDQLYKPVKGEKLKKTLSTYYLLPTSYFLFVGTIQPRKNLERLIKAYALWLKQRPKSEADKVFDAVPRADGGRLTNLKGASLNSASGTLQPDEGVIKLVLVGNKGWLSDSIYKLPYQLNIEDKVNFLGYVSDQDMPALYSGARAFLFPSLFEGFGLPVLEAFACGCPVLTSNVSSLPEVAGRAAILVNPYSVESIAQGIERLQSRVYRVQLIKKGLKQVKKFSWEKAALQTVQVLSSV